MVFLKTLLLASALSSITLALPTSSPRTFNPSTTFETRSDVKQVIYLGMYGGEQVSELYTSRGENYPFIHIGDVEGGNGGSFCDDNTENLGPAWSTIGKYMATPPNMFNYCGGSGLPGCGDRQLVLGLGGTCGLNQEYHNNEDFYATVYDQANGNKEVGRCTTYVLEKNCGTAGTLIYGASVKCYLYDSLC